MPVPPIFFVKAAAACAGALGVTDILAQCYAHRKKQGRWGPTAHARDGADDVTAAPPTCTTTLNGTQDLPPPSDDAEPTTALQPFQWNALRTARSMAWAAAAGPVVFGGTLLIIVPTMWPSIVMNVGATEMIFLPVAASINLNRAVEPAEYGTKLPPSLVIALATTAVGCYTLGAVVLGHRIVFWPALSSLGEAFPESALYTVGFATGAVLYGMLVNTVEMEREEAGRTVHTSAVFTSEEVPWVTPALCGYTAAAGLYCDSLFPAAVVTGLPAVLHFLGTTAFLAGTSMYMLSFVDEAPPMADATVAMHEPTPGDATKAAALVQHRQRLFTVFCTLAVAYPMLWGHWPVVSAVCEATGGVAYTMFVASLRDDVGRLKERHLLRILTGQYDRPQPALASKVVEVVDEAKE